MSRSMEIIPSISSEQVSALRSTHPYEQDERWVLEVARRRGWAEANREFLQDHRDRGADEMRALMGALGVERLETRQQASALLRLPYRVFMPPAIFKGAVLPLDDGRVRVVVGRCPMFEKIERQGSPGVTACGSWHHRRGWFDAMGVEVEDAVQAEQSWGEPACVTELTFLLPG